MSKAFTTQEFICRAKEVHGDRYDYSKVVYVNNYTKVCIICPEHGEFWQNASNHLRKAGCPKCFHTSRKRKIFGVGINDTDNVIHNPSYHIWRQILMRCYDSNSSNKFQSYKGVTVCSEWLMYSNFKRWFDENHIDGFELDKDILSGIHKVYSPQTCCFIPKTLNQLISKSTSNQIGYKRRNGRFYPSMQKDGRKISLGAFGSEKEALVAYKSAKEAYVKELAEIYYSINQIEKRVYDALMGWTLS